MITVIIIGTLFLLSFAIGCVVTFRFVVVQEGKIIIIERNGRFHRSLGPGRYVLNRFFFKIAGIVDMRVDQSEKINIRVKTSDFIVFDISTSYLYQVNPAMIYEAFYRISPNRNYHPPLIGDHDLDISYAPTPIPILNNALTHACQSAIEHLTFSEFYERQGEVHEDVRHSLVSVAEPFGYHVPRVFLIPNISDSIASMTMQVESDSLIVEKMNHLYRSKRLNEALVDMEAMILQGQGEAGRLMSILTTVSDLIKEWTPDAIDRLTDFIQIVSVLIPSSGVSAKTNILLTPDVVKAFRSIKDLSAK